jgi:hypothetical protein
MRAANRQAITKGLQATAYRSDLALFAVIERNLPQEPTPGLNWQRGKSGH